MLLDMPKELIQPKRKHNNKWSQKREIASYMCTATYSSRWIRSRHRAQHKSRVLKLIIIFLFYLFVCLCVFIFAFSWLLSFIPAWCRRFRAPPSAFCKWNEQLENEKYEQNKQHFHSDTSNMVHSMLEHPTIHNLILAKRHTNIAPFYCFFFLFFSFIRSHTVFSINSCSGSIIYI